MQRHTTVCLFVFIYTPRDRLVTIPRATGRSRSTYGSPLLFVIKLTSKISFLACARVCVQGLVPSVPLEQCHQFRGRVRHLLSAWLHGGGARSGHRHCGSVRCKQDIKYKSSKYLVTTLVPPSGILFILLHVWCVEQRSISPKVNDFHSQTSHHISQLHIA